MDAERVEAICVRAEQWAREYRLQSVTARLRGLRGAHVAVPADWRERYGEPSIDCDGGS